jgi:hypothetical protein
MSLSSLFFSFEPLKNSNQRFNFLWHICSKKGIKNNLDFLKTMELINAILNTNKIFFSNFGPALHVRSSQGSKKKKKLYIFGNIYSPTSTR